MPSENSPLLSLPAELRLEVYAHFFAPTTTTRTATTAILPPPLDKSPLALSLACRQLYDETHALAFAATTFHTRAWRLADLKELLVRVRPPYRPHITSLKVHAGVYDFLKHPQSLSGLRLAAAGLRGIREIYVHLEGEATQAESREGLMICNLELLIRKTIASCDNDELQKIHVVHQGRIFWNGAPELYKKYRAQFSHPDPRLNPGNCEVDMLQGNQFRFVKKGKDSKIANKVTVWMEAVTYPSQGKDA
ncbi:uncharacterized protein BDZ99DRAFT_513286 [Mytilinidion resinicola]|uniref:Uncharacterized protein n=1 Tax=Mytilinidion resinicola TaxID=574789 RepID=A0A6A6Z7D8_9PEZI|nr:uncharacterized protein BDZ99DRAFT_513286 [Mytilinidion resinicola]KAF2817021.1 hypothetical protein BDZ99DRAFT_513286 [Mytilinidion resinicola]